MNLEKVNLTAFSIAKKHFKSLKKTYHNLVDSGELTSEEVNMACLIVLSYLTQAHGNMHADPGAFERAYLAVLARAKQQETN